MSTFGRIYRITTAGESHSQAVTVIVEGVPAGMYLSLRRHVQPFVDRRRPGQSDLTTPRTEADTVEISSGIEQKHLMYYYNYTPPKGAHHPTDNSTTCRYPLSDVLTPKSWLLDGEGPDISNIYVESNTQQPGENNNKKDEVTGSGTNEAVLARFPTPEEIEAIRHFDETVLLVDRSQGITLGTPLSLTVKNKDTRKQDYNFYNFMNLIGGGGDSDKKNGSGSNGQSSSSFVPRPSHGDLTYFLKYGGHVASSGGGRSSARETVARVIGGAVAQRVLWWLAWGGKRRRSDSPSPRKVAAQAYNLRPLLLVVPSSNSSPPALVAPVRIPTAFPRVVAYTLQVGGVSGTSCSIEKQQSAEVPSSSPTLGSSSSALVLNPDYPLVVDESTDTLGTDMHLLPSAGTLLTNQLLGLAPPVMTAQSPSSSSLASGSFTRLLQHRPAVEVTSRAPPSKSILHTDMAIRHRILESGKAHDSIGGIVRCVIENCPFGLGEPVFDKLEAMLAHAMMSIPASKGFLMGYGEGFASASGSAVNDKHMKTPPQVHDTNGGCDCEGGEGSDDDTTPSLSTTTNHSGGVCGGISNGGRIYFDVIFKPPATIGVAQETCDSLGNPTVLAASGRHDPCVVPRAVPVVEAMAMAVLLDCLSIAT